MLGEHLLVVGDGGFEPPKSSTTDLQSAPFGLSGNRPYLFFEIKWWAIRDSNPGPTGYEPAALTD